MGDYINNNTEDANEEMVGQAGDGFDQTYSVARYETTSGPWHNILDVPGTETWPGQAVYATGEDHSPTGSAVAMQGSNEDLPQTGNGDKTEQKKRKKKNATKSDKKKDSNGTSKKDEKDGDEEGKKDRHRGHKSHGHGHRSQRAG